MKDTMTSPALGVRGRTQRGFAILTALFLLVMLAALGTFMLSFSNTQQLTSAQDVQGSRAYWAARAGIECALGEIKVHSACAVPPSAFSVDGFTVSVTYGNPESHGEGTTTKTVCRVTSTATSSGSVGTIDYVERSVTASLEF